ncbi:MAG: hypothetical protein ACPG4T_15025, partial [Nannocystaceae bacterium]
MTLNFHSNTPKTHSTRTWLALAAGALACGLSLGACDSPKNIGDESDSGNAACTPGEEMPAEDGCNTCVCSDEGEWGCTELGCEESESDAMCMPGEQMPAEDGCNTCTCLEGGEWACTEIACECTPGESKPDPQTCGECLCSEEGTWACEGPGCPPPMCEPGDMMPSEDGCNVCECDGQGMWSCTEEPCPEDTLPMCSGEEPDDPMFVVDAVIAGDTLSVDLEASGGCAEHIYGGCWDSVFDESDPVQTGVNLSHDSMDDDCDAIVY